MTVDRKKEIYWFLESHHDLGFKEGEKYFIYTWGWMYLSEVKKCGENGEWRHYAFLKCDTNDRNVSSVTNNINCQSGYVRGIKRIIDMIHTRMSYVL